MTFSSTRPAGAKTWSRRQLAVIAVKLAVTLLALAALMRLVDLDAFFQRVRLLEWSLCGVALLALLIQLPVMAARWRLVLRWLGVPVPTHGRVFAITYAGQFFGQVLPFIAGDAIRAWLIAADDLRFRAAVRSVLVDRAVALIVLLVLAIPPLMLSPVLQRVPAVTHPVISVIAAGLASIVVALALSKTLMRLAGERRILGLVPQVFDDLRRLTLSAAVVPVIVLAVAIHALTVIAVVLISQAIGLQLDVLDCMAIVPPMLIAAMVPVSFSGWGMREGVVVLLLGAAGVPAESALLLSIIFGAAVLVVALPGLPVWLLLARRPAAAESAG